jgi:2'-5' RNA ligase
MGQERIFIGIRIDPEIVERLLPVQDVMTEDVKRSSRVRPEQFHVTTLFIGDVTGEQRTRIEEEVADVVRDVPSFDCRLEGLGGFPPGGATRVVWAGVTTGTDVLTDLHGRLKSRLDWVLRPDHGYTPHVTLAYIKDRRGQGTVKRRLQAAESVVYGSFHVDSIALYRSRLTHEGAMYEVLREYGLDGAPGLP